MTTPYYDYSLGMCVPVVDEEAEERLAAVHRSGDALREVVQWALDECRVRKTTKGVWKFTPSGRNRFAFAVACVVMYHSSAAVGRAMTAREVASMLGLQSPWVSILLSRFRKYAKSKVLLDAGPPSPKKKTQAKRKPGPCNSGRSRQQCARLHGQPERRSGQKPAGRSKMNAASRSLAIPRPPIRQTA